MRNSEKPDTLEAKHEDDQQQRLEGIVRWVEYITEQPVEVWGPQQNAIVNSQLESARQTDLGAEHTQRVRAVVDEMMDDRSDDSSDS